MKRLTADSSRAASIGDGESEELGRGAIGERHRTEDLPLRKYARELNAETLSEEGRGEAENDWLECDGVMQ